MKLIYKAFLSAVLISSTLINSPTFAKTLVSKHGMAVGDKLPPFDLKTETGRMMKFDENFKGKVLLLVVCNYCNKDLSGSWTIQSFYKHYKSPDFRYTVVFSRRCIPGFVPGWFIEQSSHSTATQVKIPYFLMDWDEEVAEKLKASIDDPHVYVVDKNGVIRFKQILVTPFVSTDKMNSVIDKLLDAK